MNKKILAPFGLGIASIVILILSSFVNSFSLLSTTLSFIGSFIGIWYLFSLVFKSLVLDKNEMLYLVVGTFASLAAFGLGRYGFLIFFWLPSMILTVFILRLLVIALNKMSRVMMTHLPNKITDMEKEIRQRENNQPTNTQN